MNRATFWKIVCDTRHDAGYPSLVADPWCKRLLSEAAVQPPEPVGVDGMRWTFSDGSWLLANSLTVMVH